jgi:hypothetical protein
VLQLYQVIDNDLGSMDVVSEQAIESETPINSENSQPEQNRGTVMDVVGWVDVTGSYGKCLS